HLFAASCRIRRVRGVSLLMVFDGADRHAQDAGQSHGAAQVGLAAPTCSRRLKTLRERGIIKGFHADIDLEALGVYVFGMISVRMMPVVRSKIGSIAIGPKPPTYASGVRHRRSAVRERGRDRSGGGPSADLRLEHLEHGGPVAVEIILSQPADLAQTYDRSRYSLVVAVQRGIVVHAL